MKTITIRKLEPLIGLMESDPKTSPFVKQVLAGADLVGLGWDLVHNYDHLSPESRQVIIDYYYQDFGPIRLATYYLCGGFWGWSLGYCPFTLQDFSVLEAEGGLPNAFLNWILASQSQPIVIHQFNSSELRPTGL